MAIDIKSATSGWEVIEGPFYSPPLAAPNLMELGTTAGLHLDRWPAGRYSIILMARITEAEPGKPILLEVIDLMVLTLVAASAEQKQYGNVMFEELDSVAVLDGHTFNLNGLEVTPLIPGELDLLFSKNSETADPQYSYDVSSTNEEVSDD
jgi:hypothetical protein